MVISIYLQLLSWLLVPAQSAPIDVLLYDLELKIYPGQRYISGVMQIEARSLGPDLNEVSLDLVGMTVDRAADPGGEIVFSREGGKLHLSLSSSYNPGDTLQLSIYYRGTPQRGLYFRINSFGDTIVYSHNEPYDARYWFPCVDDPADKAFSRMMVEVPEQYELISNGELVDIVPGEAGRRFHFWQENYAISTYLITVAAGPFEIASRPFDWSGEEMPLYYYAYPQHLSRAEAALVETADQMLFFSDYIGVYPFIEEKYAMVEVPFGEAAAMENQTATTMRDNIMDNSNIIAHELAHQWWGDALTPQSFSDIWLNEGFATYFDALYTEYKFGPEAFRQQMTRSQSNLANDGSLEFPVLDPPPQYLFGNAVYNKGAWILHMLREKTGRPVFRQICRRYYELFAYGNVTTQDFITVSENVSGLELSAFFDQWLAFAGMPQLQLSWEQEQEDVKINIGQVQSGIVYDLDLDVLVRGISRDTMLVVNSADRITEKSFVFSEPVRLMQIDPDDRVLETNNTPVQFIPGRSRLVTLYPNPFNENLTVIYQVEKRGRVKLELFNIAGQRVELLLDEQRNIGVYDHSWQAGGKASGTYFVVLQTGDTRDIRKVVLLK